MARARLHLICGNCGCNDLWKYKIDPEGRDVDGELFPSVSLVCGNCATLHDLADHAENGNPSQKLCLAAE